MYMHHSALPSYRLINASSDGPRKRLFCDGSGVWGGRAIQCVQCDPSVPRTAGCPVWQVWASGPIKRHSNYVRWPGSAMFVPTQHRSITLYALIALFSMTHLGRGLNPQHNRKLHAQLLCRFRIITLVIFTDTFASCACWKCAYFVCVIACSKGHTKKCDQCVQCDRPVLGGDKHKFITSLLYK